jgi:hypothetical protein
LAILELKATENVDLPLQAGEYWSRIRRHQPAGNLARYRYFHGITLQEAAPLVYLISPVLRFHPSTDALLLFLTPEMEVIRIGPAEGWRRGLRVMVRQQQFGVRLVLRSVGEFNCRFHGVSMA